MSLDYQLTEIKNWETLCVRKNEGGEGARLNPKTNALVWASMLIDLGSITPANVDEWEFRLRCLYRIDLGPTAREDTPVREDIEQHIGLRMNVIDESRAYFMKRIRKMLEQVIKDEMAAAARKERAA